MDKKYKYTYEKTANYCYKDSDVLINKLNITNEKDLYDAERGLVALRTAQLNEEAIKGYFDFNHLNSIHKFFFKIFIDGLEISETVILLNKICFVYVNISILLLMIFLVN